MAQDCGSYGSTQSSSHIEWKNSKGYGSGIPVGRGSSGVNCFNVGAAAAINQAVGAIKKKTQLVSTVLAAQCIGIKGCNKMVTTYEDVTGLKGNYNANVGITAQTGSLPLYPFSINASADVKVFYRNVSGENHLIVQLSNIFSYIIGDQNADNPNQTEYTVACTNPFAFTVAVSMQPTPADTDWKYCFGGWRASPCTDCVNEPCNYMNIGGFLYHWNSRRVDAPFANSPWPGRQNPGPYEWDLGNVTTDANTVLYISAAATSGSNSCASQRKTGTGRTMIAITPPPLNVCPPEVIHMGQERDICEDCAYTNFIIGANDLLDQPKAKVVVEYVWKATLDNVDWSKAEVARYDINKNEELDFNLPCLIPSSHYAYRLKIVLDTDYAAESEYVYGEFDTLYIPPANMSVPTITVQECTDINRGGLIAPFEEPVSYGG